MRYDPKAWEKGLVNTKSLSIDLENPRFAFRDFQNVYAVEKYLIEKENIIDLANSIANYGGLYDYEDIIVYRDDKNNYTTLEGNRRTVACKLLLNPGEFFANDSDLDAVPAIDTETKERISNIRASIVNDRRIADHVIADIHLFGKKDWKFINQITYARNKFLSGTDALTISRSMRCTSKEIQYFLRCYTVVEIAKSILVFDRAKADMLYEKDQEIQRLTKIVLSPLTTKYFGTPLIWDNAQPNYAHHDDLIDKLTKIIDHTIFPQNEAIFKLAHGPIEVYLDTIFRKDTRQMELGISPSVSYVAPHKKDSLITEDLKSKLFTELVTKTPNSWGGKTQLPSNIDECVIEKHHTNREQKYASPHSIENSDYLPRDENKNNEGTLPQTKTKEVFFENLYCTIDDYRLLQLTKEIVSISNRSKGLSDCAISASFLMRALLEWSLLIHIERAALLDDLKKYQKIREGHEPSLSDLLIYSEAIKDVSIIPSKLIKKIRFIRELNWINDLNFNIHNDLGNITVDRLKSIAADIRPIIRWIFGYGVDNSDD